MNQTKQLTTAPIPGLIRRLAIPASIGFFFNTMYNVVDVYFAGMLSTQALAALSLSFPVFFSIVALGSGFSTGVTAVIGHELGSDNQRAAETFSAQSLTFSLLLSVFLMIVGILAAPFLFGILGASGDYLNMCLTYINPIFYGSPFFILTFILNGNLQATGDTRSFRNFLIVGFVLNCILDPWFIFGGFGLPAFGLKGVAIATVVIQVIGCVYLGIQLLRTGLISTRCLQALRPRLEPYREIARQGFPASANMLTVGIGIFIITYFISYFGQQAVAAYGVATRVIQIVLLPTIGLNIATLTLVAQNNGARRFDRVKETVATATKYGMGIMLIGLMLVYFLAHTMMHIFTDDANVVEIGSFYLQIEAFALFAYVILFINVSAMQGLKRPMFAIWIGLFRQIVAPFVLFTLFAHVFGWGLLGIWWGIFCINWISALITIYYARRLIGEIFPTSPPVAQEMSSPP